IDDVRVACGLVVPSSHQQDEEEDEESNDGNWGWDVEQDSCGSSSSSDVSSDEEYYDDEMFPHPGRKRRRTLVSGERTGLGDGDANGTVEGGECVFDNEKPEARTWAEMDEEGWLARVNGGEV